MSFLCDSGWSRISELMLGFPQYGEFKDGIASSDGIRFSHSLYKRGGGKFYIFGLLFKTKTIFRTILMDPKLLSFKLNQKFIAIILLFIGLNTSGQENKVVSDLGLWTEIKLEKKFLGDFRFNVSQHLRLNNNITDFDNYISEIGLIYNINKNCAIGVNGRYTRNKKYSGLVENNYRYDLDFRYERKLSERLKLFYRLRYQKEFYGSGVFYEEVNYYESEVRNRVKLRWKLNEIHRFYGSGEIFRLTKKSREPYFNQYRLWFGDDIISTVGGIDLAFGLEHQLNNSNPYTFYIFKIKYEFEL